MLLADLGPAMFMAAIAGVVRQGVRVAQAAISPRSLMAHGEGMRQVELRRQPGARGMAKRTVRAEEPRMIGRITMASGTLRGYGLENCTLMALHTGYGPVRSGQREIRASVVEGRIPPFRRLVASAAEGTVLPFMGILLNMALRTFGRRAGEPPTYMAALTTGLHMSPFQRIGGEVVVQRDLLPPLLVVAARAVEAQLPGVRVIRCVTFKTSPGCSQES